MQAQYRRAASGAVIEIMQPLFSDNSLERSTTTIVSG